LYAYLPTYLITYLLTYLFTYLFNNLLTNLVTYVPTYFIAVKTTDLSECDKRLPHAVEQFVEAFQLLQ